MSFLIDTSILFELQKGEAADVGVKIWYAKCSPNKLYLSVLAVGEIRQGIERLRLRDPRQAEQVDQNLTALLLAMHGRILPITESVVQQWGLINAIDPLYAIDSLLAATALEHGLTLVTRNATDIQRSGATCLNPFSEQA
jgi:predicted nucleic acid-binding protein